MLAARSINSETGEKLKEPAPSSRRRHDGGCSSGHKAGDIVDGRYKLIEPLGQGGMGVVWKARSTALDVDVAVKLVRSTVASPEAFKRMAREAHAAARLGHPAVARVLDFGSTQDEHPYVVMELLHGESLADVLDRERKIDVIRAISILLPLIEGLREAHDKGIVHRDIKPENLFVTRTSRGRFQPKVLDFGIAKLDQQTDTSTKLTQDGAVLGSPGYFSPEQACGQLDIDHRTDIWSISVVLYELITGRIPFSGPNYNALLMSILQDTPLSIMTHGFGDADLWEILVKGLARDRDERWSSMGDLGEALAGWLYNQGVRADITARSLKEVWLQEASLLESIAAPAQFSPSRANRASIATMAQRRHADTLAGGTLSAPNKHRAFPARAIAWGSAAFALCASVAALLMPDGTAAASASSAVGSELNNIQLPTPAVSIDPPKLETPVSNLNPKPTASRPQRTAGVAKGTKQDPAKSTDKRQVSALGQERKLEAKRKQKTKQRATKARSAQKKLTKVTASKPKANRSNAVNKKLKPATARKVRPRKTSVARRVVDQEFGF